MSPVLDEHTLDLISHSEAQTCRLGARLGALLQDGDVVCLEGELGTGKTCFIQGVGQGMGIEGPITSPTFVFVNEYHLPGSGRVLYHVDLYRLEDEGDAVELGLEELLHGQGVCVVEWADRARQVLPAERLWITLRHLTETKRGILAKAHGAHYQELLDRFRQSCLGV